MPITNPHSLFFRSQADPIQEASTYNDAEEDYAAEKSVTEESTHNPLLASAANALGDIDLTCSIIAFILVILLYIAWLIVSRKQSHISDLHNTNELNGYKIVYILRGLIMIFIVLYLLAFTCVILPLLIMITLMVLGIYRKII